MASATGTTASRCAPWLKLLPRSAAIPNPLYQSTRHYQTKANLHNSCSLLLEAELLVFPQTPLITRPRPVVEPIPTRGSCAGRWAASSMRTPLKMPAALATNTLTFALTHLDKPRNLLLHLL